MSAQQTAAVERFTLNANPEQPDWIYLCNPSAMMISETQRWFQQVLGNDNVEIYSLDFPMPGFCNSFRFHKRCQQKFEQEILPQLVYGDDGYWTKKAA